MQLLGIMVAFALVLCLSLAVVSTVDPPEVEYPPDSCSNVHDGAKWDFIVVGGGSAGSVVASRLAEVKSWKILLIEAGSDPPAAYELPKNAGTPITESTSWNFNSAPSKDACLGMNGGQCKYQQNRALGGCSDNNFMIYSRGNKQDYDGWEALGNPGWSYKKCLEYFKKSEDFSAYSITKSPEADSVSKKYHAKHGLLAINLFEPDPQTETLQEAIFNAGQDLGLSKNLDYNGESQIGLTRYQVTVDSDYFRENTAKAFLTRPPKNLKICKHSLVVKLILKKQKVRGVSFLNGKKTKKVYARKEVILSAGALNTPGILERSGIGDPNVLEEVGIKTVNPLLGVGNRMQDHFSLVGNVYKVELHPTGPPNKQSISISSLGGFFDSLENSSYPDIQLIFTLTPQISGKKTPNFANFINLRPDLAEEYAKAGRTSVIITASPVVLNPDSYGSVHINSTDSEAPPEIQISSLSTLKEVTTMLRGVRFVEKIMNSDELKSFSPEYVPLGLCAENAEIGSDDFYICMMRTVGSTLYNPVGTCFMGPKTDPMAVVDNKLRVHGMANLRIADASIMPKITRGNTNAPTIMIAERCADFLKTAYRSS